MKKNRINLYANVFGAILDKSLTLLIAFFLTKYLTKEAFGLWTQYLQLILICAATLISPVQLFFSREFFKDKSKPLKLFNFGALMIVLFLLGLIVFLFYKELLLLNFIVIEMLISTFLYVVYRLNSSYLRFNKKDILYAKLSLLRFAIFLTTIFIFWLNEEDITYEQLVHAFFIAHLPFVLSLRKNIEISFKINKTNILEFFRLMVYGIFTSLLSGIDKIIVTKAGYSYEELSYYAYALAIASIPSFFIEGVKQYLQPMLYNDLSSAGGYTRKSVKRIVKFVLIIFFIQITLPFLSFEILKFFKLVNQAYINTNEFYWLLGWFSFTFCIHTIYHFVNPYMFFYDKSVYLLILQVFSILIYVFLVLDSNKLNDINLAIYRLIMFIFVLFGAVIPLANKKIREKYVYKKL